MYQRSGNCNSDDKDTIIAIMMIMMPFDQKQKTDTSKFFCDQQPSFLHVKKPVFLFADIGTQLWWSLHLFSLTLHSKVQHFNRRPFPIISFFSHSSAHDCESCNRVLFKSFINLTLSYLSRKGSSGILPYVRWNFDGQGSPGKSVSVLWENWHSSSW